MVLANGPELVRVRAQMWNEIGYEMRETMWLTAVITGLSVLSVGIAAVVIGIAAVM